MLTELLNWLAWAKTDIKAVTPFVLWIGFVVVLVAMLNNRKDDNTPKSI